MNNAEFVSVDYIGEKNQVILELKFRWSYSSQTWTVSSFKGCSSFTDIICPWGSGRVKMWNLEILPYFDFVAAGSISVSQTHLVGVLQPEQVSVGPVFF